MHVEFLKRYLKVFKPCSIFLNHFITNLVKILKSRISHQSLQGLILGQDSGSAYPDQVSLQWSPVTVTVTDTGQWGTENGQR